MKRIAFKNRCGDETGKPGFTLIELLVVVGIIVLLVAILLPTMRYTRDAARRASTQQSLSMIDTGLQAYFGQFSSYPPSATGGFSIILPPNRGSVMLAEGLVGYLDSTYDGAGPTSSDPAYGFRVLPGGNEALYGPYASPTPATWKRVSDAEQFFIDGNKNEILYYRSTQAVLPRPNATLVFGTAANSLFVIADNSAAKNGDASAINSPAASTAAKFWSQVGTKDNNLNTGAVQGRDSYLLVSAGPDGIYFTNDDVLLSR